MAFNKNTSPLTPKWHETLFFRISSSLLISAVFSCLLVVAGYYSFKQDSLEAAILFAIIPTFILGIALALIQHYFEHVVKAQREIERTTQSNDDVRSELKVLLSDMRHTITDAGESLKLYEPIRRLLDNHLAQGTIIKRFIRLSMDHRPLRVWGISDKEFFEMTIEGARMCSTYDAIHHGKISSLDDSTFPQSYLSDLQGVKGQRRRIVILQPDDVVEVNDTTVINQFLIITKGTQSYWIKEEDFIDITKLDTKTSLDCALHDRKMMLRLDRKLNVATLAFSDQNDAICKGVICAFEALDVELSKKNLNNRRFHLVGGDI